MSTLFNQPPMPAVTEPKAKFDIASYMVERDKVISKLFYNGGQIK